MSTSEIYLPAMDHRDHHFQSLSCCNKLYNFFMKTLLAYALKPVILGRPLHQNLDCKAQKGTTNETDQMLHSQNQTSSEGKQESKTTTDSSMIENTEGNVNGDRKDDHEREVEEEAAMPSVVLEKKAPKKVVSINETVEEIPTSKKKLRRKKSTDKLSSFEIQEDETKPLKSILKVGSNIGDR